MELCAPEFRLVGARIRVPKCNAAWESPPSRGRATDARENESLLPIYDPKVEGRQVGLLGSGPNWAGELDWADGERIGPNWAGLDLYWTVLMGTDWAELGRGLPDWLGCLPQAELLGRHGLGCWVHERCCRSRERFRPLTSVAPAIQKYDRSGLKKN
ncbi:hypothetical protein CRG98_024244 [Punica granatum]|uniref:Uncharacterized protein n=1 Tax=Punica granatum TaxID=22663 RepID=A0A2I0JHB1_PUNGR|nr:hypothetical protein CRG98_024244 [Punica granatum]